MIRIARFLMLVYLFRLSPLFGQAPDKFLSLGITPTYFLDPITPSVAISLESRIVSRLHLELMYGYDPGMEFLNWHPDPHSRHHEYKFTVKYLLQVEDTMRTTGYLGIDYFGSYNAYQKIDDTYVVDRTYYDFDRAEVIRSVMGGRVNLGVKHSIHPRIWLDTHLGLGVRYLIVRYFPDNQVLSVDIPFDEWVVPFDRRAREEWTYAFIFGLKIEYRLY